jgi:UDP-2,3-diacylglucosamine hydrolase
LADHFLSDVHLRLDRPDRARRLLEFLEGLAPGDRLFVLGDLCDFWFASREARHGGASDPALVRIRELASSGVPTRLILGNHDAWLGPFYREVLGLEVVPAPVQIESYGRRVQLYHGHEIRGTKWWKRAMEGRTFFEAFSRLPGPAARAAQRVLERVNERTRDRVELRMIDEYLEHARGLAGRADVVLFGHVHRVHDEPGRRPAVHVLGDWTADVNYLRIDEHGIHRGGPSAAPGAGPAAAAPSPRETRGTPR